MRVSAAAVVDPLEGDRGCCLLAERVDNLSLAWRILAVGRDEELRHHPAFPYARTLECGGDVLLPGLVNAHTHLDLTHIGPQPHHPGDGFVAWVHMIRRNRLADDSAIALSARRGIDLLLAGGTVAVGDIAGSPRGRYTLAPWSAVRESPLLGVSYIECFGIGQARARLAASLQDFLDQNADAFRAAQAGGARLGLQPHAPNTVALPHYRWVLDQADRFGAPACTHLAETPEEREFITQGTGPQRGLLEELGAWDDSVLEHIGRGLHPVQHLEPVLRRARMLAAHCNDCPDAALEILARTTTPVVYCPRASEYFGADRHFGPHRYREMLEAGIEVCLGTDSIVNLPPEAADAQRGGISILDEMRRLWSRDGTSPGLLLRMATLHGAAALGLDESRFRIAEGGIVAGLIRIGLGDRAIGADPLESALRAGGPAILVR